MDCMGEASKLSLVGCLLMSICCIIFLIECLVGLTVNIGELGSLLVLAKIIIL